MMVDFSGWRTEGQSYEVFKSHVLGGRGMWKPIDRVTDYAKMLLLMDNLPFSKLLGHETGFDAYMHVFRSGKLRIIDNA